MTINNIIMDEVFRAKANKRKYKPTPEMIKYWEIKRKSDLRIADQQEEAKLSAETTEVWDEQN